MRPGLPVVQADAIHCLRGREGGSRRLAGPPAQALLYAPGPACDDNTPHDSAERGGTRQFGGAPRPSRAERRPASSEGGPAGCGRASPYRLTPYTACSLQGREGEPRQFRPGPPHRLCCTLLAPLLRRAGYGGPAALSSFLNLGGGAVGPPRGRLKYPYFVFHRPVALASHPISSWCSLDSRHQELD